MPRHLPKSADEQVASVTSAQPWDGTVNFSSYAQVEAPTNYPTVRELEAYREERLRKYDPYVNFFQALGVPADGLRVVEVGSGSSAFLYALELTGILELGIGIELSASRHDFAERWRVDGGFRCVTNVRDDFAEVTLTDGSFDRFVVLDDTYCHLRPENESYPELLLEAAHETLESGGFFIASFGNVAPLVANMTEAIRSFWVELPESNPFRYALYRQQPSADKRLLRNESIYLRRDLQETRKVEITEVCDVAEFVGLVRRSGFRAVSLYSDFSMSPFDAERSPEVIVVAEK